jgi:hypothetical protein
MRSAAAAALAALVLACTTGAVPSARAEPGGTALPPVGAPDVVILILDEYPADNMLGPDGRVDAFRFPAFAALAGRSTWFPNASASSPWTSTALPSILTGQRLPPSAPDRGGYPGPSLYVMLDAAGYSMVDGEETTQLCPARLCARRDIRPPACRVHNCVFIGPGRVARFRRWLATIRPRRRPTLWVKHLLLPHRPWIYLHSGLRTQSSRRLKGPIRGMNRLGGPRSRFLRLHNYQRHLLQLQFADRLVGRLTDRLMQRGMLRNTLLVVTGDHGYSFIGHREQHRDLTLANVHQIAPVPLFVKAPGQKSGGLDTAYASNLDVAATVADLLGLRLGYHSDGASVFSSEVRLRQNASLPEELGIPASRYEDRRAASRNQRLRLFGFGRHGFWDGIGPNRQLVGRHVSRLVRGQPSRRRARFVAAHRLRAVRRSSGLLPIHIAGDLPAGRRQGPRRLALAVNGRIEAVGRSFHVAGAIDHFAFLVPPKALREGRNRVLLFDVGRAAVLHRLGSV